MDSEAGFVAEYFVSLTIRVISVINRLNFSLQKSLPYTFQLSNEVIYECQALCLILPKAGVNSSGRTVSSVHSKCFELSWAVLTATLVMNLLLPRLR